VRCELSKPHVHAYVDGELDAAGTANFEQHLKSCADCASTLASAQSLRTSLQQEGLYERAPIGLRKKILSSLPAAAPPVKQGTSAIRWLALAAALVIAAFLGTEIFVSIGKIGQRPLAIAAVDAHLRSLQPGHLTDVESSDQHTVKPWFDGKVDFAPPVRDFVDQGFPLLGGRLDVLEGHTVAALIYGRRKHIVSVFVSKPQGSETSSGAGELQGYHWLTWQKNGFLYCAVSDAAPGDLQQLQELLLQE
jgi:anti-sigma factor RsiW